jgi:hypothetical protein
VTSGDLSSWSELIASTQTRPEDRETWRTTQHTLALCVMDVQRGIVERFPGSGVFLARLAGSIEGREEWGSR